MERRFKALKQNGIGAQEGNRPELTWQKRPKMKKLKGEWGEREQGSLEREGLY